MSTIKQQFGARVRELRKARNLTGGQLSQKTGLDPAYISKIELGRIGPGLEIIVRLATGLGVHPTNLLVGLGGNDG